ncbi:hypothetical protein TKK_0007170 [Trichogramma kaykai]
MALDHKNIVKAVDADNMAHWLIATDICAVLRLYHGYDGFAIVPNAQCLKRIINDFKASKNITVWPIILHVRKGRHWSSLVLEKTADLYFAYHQDSYGDDIEPDLRKVLKSGKFNIFDAKIEQQPIDDANNCGVHAIENVVDTIEFLKKLKKAQVTTTPVSSMFQQALKSRDQGALNLLRRGYATFLRLHPAYDEADYGCIDSDKTRPMRLLREAPIVVIDLEETEPTTATSASPVTRAVASTPLPLATSQRSTEKSRLKQRSLGRKYSIEAADATSPSKRGRSSVRRSQSPPPPPPPSSRPVCQRPEIGLMTKESAKAVYIPPQPASQTIDDSLWEDLDNEAVEALV